MKQTKFLFPLLMAIVMMAMSPARAWAEEYPVLTGGTHTIDIAAYQDGYTEFSHYTTIFKYVAPKGGTLTVYTEGEGDTASALFDEDKKTLTYDDDSGNSRNFKFSYKVVKDHTYYIGVCSSKDFTNYTLVIDESDLCDHEIVNHVCTICGKHQSRIVSVPAGVTVTDDDGNPITSEDYIWEGRTVNISVNASEVTAPIYIGLDATTAEGSRLNIRNNSFVMPGSDVTLNYMAIPSEPLCFEAKEDGAKIGFSSIVSDYILYYSTDKENWTSFNYDDTHYLPTLANAGDKIYLIGNVKSSSDWSYTQVKIEDANVAVSGKLSSILGGATIIYDFGCYKMFYYNENLISAPDMSDITEIGKCGCDEMFRGCSALTTAPAMSSLTAIGQGGCHFMFYVCSALTTAPAMSSLTTIGDEGCNLMFGHCSALTTAPAMSSLTAIGNLGCDGMFSHCPQLTGFEFNTVPYVVESGFYDFGTDNITLNLSDDSYVYVGENPGFPTVTSVTAPCTLNLTGSVVENHANLNLNHGTKIEEKDAAHLVSSNCITDTYHYSCSKCHGNLADTYTAAGTGSHNFTSHTLTTSPIEDGLYAYACDNGCGTHTDDHIIKDFNGEGNHLELTKDGEGNYSTSEDITIADGAPFSSPVDFTANRVTYTRNVSANQVGKWQALYVPFRIPVEMLTPSYDVASIQNFHEYTDENGVVQDVTLEVRYVKSGTLKANHPYLIRPKDVAGEKIINLNNAVLAEAQNASIVCQSVERRYTFTGIYQPMQGLYTNNYLFMAGGSLNMAASDETELKAQRWYLAIEDLGSQVDNAPAPAPAKGINISVIGDDSTGIEDIKVISTQLSGANAAAIYDLQGRRQQNMSRGVNIVRQEDGSVKKIMVK